MKWSNKPPEVQGWYWIRLGERLRWADSNPCVVNVYFKNGGIYDHSTGDKLADGLQWAGPLLPPTETEAT